MRQLMFLQALNEALAEEMERDETVFILGEGVQGGAFLVTGMGLVQTFGTDRVMDTPLSETAIAGAAVGAAMAGYRPVADLQFADFVYICGDEVFNKAAKWRFVHGGKMKLPLVIFAAIGGYGSYGSEHSQCPESLVLHNPGLKLVLPSTPYDGKGLLKTAIRDDNPVVFFYHKQLLGDMGDIPDEEYTVPFGVADIKKEGSDVTAIATAYEVKLALEAARQLEANVSVEVIDPRTLEPLDIETILASVEKTGRVVIVDEDTERCGVTCEIAMRIMEKGFDLLDAPIRRVAAKNYPIPAGPMEELVLPQVGGIVAAIEAVMG
jgi:pyruvate/2-oxoglutarate/acetoin dehydrogenase E1 component